ncbi:I78 family peptidase inhibitor [Sphingomonas adhaesiva]|uniref:I78 family peptidase inhibitor n=1 Tax=Sphingomonas adhaesiva TaxID=28212 RepID=UPI002FFBBB66
MKFAIAPALVASALLAGCATGGRADQAAAGTCRPNAARTLVGQAVPNDAEILRRTGSTTVRRLAPGDMATKDYRIERVTVTVDGGKVVSASCG